MKVSTFSLGDFQTNAYVLQPSAQSPNVWIIDPGYDPEPLIKFLQENNLSPITILLTHAHCDHIAGIPFIKEQFPQIKVAVSQPDAASLSSSMKNLSMLMGAPFTLDPPDQILTPDNHLDLDDLKVIILETPGHTPGGLSFYCTQHDILFSGDTLFAGSIGRTDFPGGSHKTLLKSIRTQIFPLPDQTLIYPGHGPGSRIAQEKHSNPFFR